MKLFVLSVLNLALGAVPASGAVLYTIQMINPLPGDSIVGVTGINASGQVAANSSLSSGFVVEHSFIYTNGLVTPISTLPLASVPRGINNAGEVAGFLIDPSTAATHPFSYSNGTITTLGFLPGFTEGAAYSINNQGTIVGNDFSATQRTMFLYSGGALTDLGLPGFPTGINDSGQIAGGTNLSGFFYDGRMLTYIPELPGDTGGTYATALNNAGQVVGISISHPGIGSGHGLSHAILYDHGTVASLNTLPGVGPNDQSGAYGINDRGEAVGYVYTQADYGAALFANGVVIDLNAQLLDGSGWSLQEAHAINGAGQIAGIGKFQGRDVGFLLTPAEVPEPATAALVGLSGLLIVLVRRRGSSPKI